MKKIGILYKANFLSPKGIFFLILAFCLHGINLLTLLKFVSKIYPNRIAVKDDCESVTYKELYIRTLQTAVKLKHCFNLSPGNKAGILCKNHLSLLYSIFSFSALGIDIYLLNTEMSEKQLSDFIQLHPLDLLVYDSDKRNVITAQPDQRTIPAYGLFEDSIQFFSTQKQVNLSLPKSYGGKLVVFTGGSTGKPKPAERKTSVSDFLSPFYSLLSELKLYQYNNVYITTPVYHGFGFAALCLSISLGSHINLTADFDAEKCANLIQSEKIEVITTVPTILNRLISYSKKLKTLRCIISGGSHLSPSLIKNINNHLNQVHLYNAYGTSEVGFCILATPTDIAHFPNSIGKPINRTFVTIKDRHGNTTSINQIGQIFVSCPWSAHKNQLINTGDLGYKDKSGYIYLTGRIDEMIISGGINVYRRELEIILCEHPYVQEAVVIGIEDDDFGQRLWAFVVSKNRRVSDETVLQEWLKGRATRYQIPKGITFINHLPLTPMGKPDKNKLLQLLAPV